MVLCSQYVIYFSIFIGLLKYKPGGMKVDFIVAKKKTYNIENMLCHGYCFFLLCLNIHDFVVLLQVGKTLGILQRSLLVKGGENFPVDKSFDGIIIGELA